MGGRGEVRFREAVVVKNEHAGCEMKKKKTHIRLGVDGEWRGGGGGEGAGEERMQVKRRKASGTDSHFNLNFLLHKARPSIEQQPKS